MRVTCHMSHACNMSHVTGLVAAASERRCVCGKGKGEAVACCVDDAECVQLGVTCDACMTCDTHMSRDTWLQRGASVACAGRERQRLTSTVTFASWCSCCLQLRCCLH